MWIWGSTPQVERTGKVRLLASPYLAPRLFSQWSDRLVRILTNNRLRKVLDKTNASLCLQAKLMEEQVFGPAQPMQSQHAPTPMPVGCKWISDMCVLAFTLFFIARDSKVLGAQLDVMWNMLYGLEVLTCASLSPLTHFSLTSLAPSTHLPRSPLSHLSHLSQLSHMRSVRVNSCQ